MLAKSFLSVAPQSPNKHGISLTGCWTTWSLLRWPPVLEFSHLSEGCSRHRLKQATRSITTCKVPHSLTTFDKIPSFIT